MSRWGRCSKFQETTENIFAYGSAFLGVELRGVEVILVQGGAERNNVIAGGGRELAHGDVEAVDEVDEAIVHKQPLIWILYILIFY